MAKTTKSTIFGTSKGYDIQIGNVYENATPQTLYPRQAARELWKIENVNGFTITEMNKAGRRFTCEFFDANRKVVKTKRVYREYVESMIDQLGLTAPDASTETAPAKATKKATATGKSKKNAKGATSKEVIVDDTPDMITEPLEFA